MTAVIIAALLCSAQGQAAPDSTRTEVHEDFLAEGVAATVGGALGGAAAVGLGYGAMYASGAEGWDALGVFGLGLLSGVVTIPAGAAAGAGLVGRSLGQDGRFWPAFLGGLVGLPIGYFAAGTGIALSNGSAPVVVISAVGGLVVTGAGAAIGYNLSRSPANRAHAWLERLEPPATFTTMVLDENGAVHAGVGCRLVTVRF